MVVLGLSQWFSSKESVCKAGAERDVGSIPASGRSPGGGHGKPLQYSYLKNPKDRGTCWAMIHGITNSQTQLKGLSMHACNIDIC